MKKTIIISTTIFFGLVCIIGGGICLLLQRHYVILCRLPKVQQFTEATKKYTETQYAIPTTHDTIITVTNTRTVLEKNNMDIAQLINQWLLLLHARTDYPTTTVLQTAVLTPDTHTLYLSWNSNPFPTAWSTAKKITLLRALATTIHDAYPTIISLYMLVNHTTMHDNQLDCSQPWIIADL